MKKDRISIGKKLVSKTEKPIFSNHFPALGRTNEPPGWDRVGAVKELWTYDAACRAGTFLPKLV